MNAYSQSSTQNYGMIVAKQTNGGNIKINSNTNTFSNSAKYAGSFVYIKNTGTTYTTIYTDTGSTYKNGFSY